MVTPEPEPNLDADSESCHKLQTQIMATIDNGRLGLILTLNILL